ERAAASVCYEEALLHGKTISCPHIQSLAHFGSALTGNRSEAAYRHLRLAKGLLDSQLKGLAISAVEDYLALDERWRIYRGDLSPEEIPGQASSATLTSGNRYRYQQQERKYLDLLDEKHHLTQTLEEATTDRDRLKRLLTFTVETHRETDLNQLLDGIMSLMGQIMEADRGFLLLREGDLLKPRSTYNIDVRDRRPQTWRFSESIADRVFRTGESVFIDDALEADGFKAAQSIVDLNVRTVVCVPLRAVARGSQHQGPAEAQTHIIGVIYLDRQSISNAFKQQDLVLVEHLAQQASQAIENARLHTDSADKAAKLERLNELARLVSTTLELRKVLDMVVHKTLEHTKAERAFVFLKDNQGKLVCRMAMDSSNYDISDLQVQISNSITRQVLETGTSVCLLDTRNSEIFQAQKSILDLELRTIMCVAFRKPRAGSTNKRRDDKRQRPDVEQREPREEYHGVLYVDSKVVVNAFTERDLHLLESIASLASSAIYNAQLYERATIDGLTKLYFRSFFEQRLQEEVGRARRIGAPLSVLMCDIDHFKRFNDTYGHATGDDVLCLVAEVIRTNIREGDIHARYGGEEMLVLMPDTPLEGAQILAERLREAIAKAALAGPNGEALHVNVSIGVAQLGPDEEPNQLVEHADHAMYLSKNGGRNRVTLYQLENIATEQSTTSANT
ncbi:MAG: diguanylate cyclase, partial [Cyanobacteria bacterium NC_groundwater_1444_Ag_S-0.65um_54_12]|nr:diguanylate cyclase [Cyanobacteria bacterium NC_groundwater_1444_Ag_S-0.65um_54_12]